MPPKQAAPGSEFVAAATVTGRDGKAHTFASGYGSFGDERIRGEAAYEASFAAPFTLPRDHRITMDPNPNYDKVDLDTPIAQHTRGYQLLLKMGWKENTPLGAEGSKNKGILEPIKMATKNNGDLLGLGKATEYTEMSEQAAAERRKLETELELTEEEKATRLAKLQVRLYLVPSPSPHSISLVLI